MTARAVIFSFAENLYGISDQVSSTRSVSVTLRFNAGERIELFWSRSDD